MASPVRDQIIEQVDRLNSLDQERVLEYAKSIAHQDRQGVPGRDLLRFAGAISKEDADLMMQAIDQDCGRVDPNEW